MTRPVTKVRRHIRNDSEVKYPGEKLELDYIGVGYEVASRAQDGEISHLEKVGPPVALLRAVT